MRRTTLQSAPHDADPGPVCRVVHPHHPLSGQYLDVISRCKHHGEDRVSYRDARGQERSMPVAWTSLVTADPFVVVAAGRSLFRIDDLLALVALLRDLKAEGKTASKGGRQDRA